MDYTSNDLLLVCRMCTRNFISKEECDVYGYIQYCKYCIDGIIVERGGTKKLVFADEYSVENPPITDEDMFSPRTLARFKKMKDKNKNKKDCYFITITCSKDGWNTKKFVQKVHKVFSSTCIERCIYNFEWRANDEDISHISWGGIHSHGWIDSYDKRKLNQHLRRLKNVKGIYVDIGFFNKEYKKEKFDYMNGNTFNEEKDKLKLIDKKNRKDLGLKNIYTKNENKEYCDLCDVVNTSGSQLLTTEEPPEIPVNNKNIVVNFD